MSENNILTKLAGNKHIAQLAFKQIKKHIKEDNISLIAIYVDDNGDVTGREYNESVIILKQSDYVKMLNKIQQIDQKAISNE